MAVEPKKRALRVTVWNEGEHERRGTPAELFEHYSNGIGGAIADGLAERMPEAHIRCATLTDPKHGLSEDALADTDVLLWWGHVAHDQVSDEVVERVKTHVLGGMGLIALHSAHFSKIFCSLMGTTCSLNWRSDADRELVWTTNPAHPIAAGVPSPLVIPRQEMYGELFDIPQPDDLIFISGFEGGEVFRSGVTYSRGHGRVFYFSPGDQEYPVYNQPEIRLILANAVQWAARPELHRHEQPVVSNPARSWFE
jgi:trehalose utilization protein